MERILEILYPLLLKPGYFRFDELGHMVKFMFSV